MGAGHLTSSADLPIDGEIITPQGVATPKFLSFLAALDEREEGGGGGASLPNGYFQGFNTANGADVDHDIDINPGVHQDGSVRISLGAVLTKQIDATWAAGTNAGGMAASLTVLPDVWYHLFIISDATGTLVDAGFDTALNADNLLTGAAGYVRARRIASVLTDGSSNIIAYQQFGSRFLWRDKFLDLDDFAPPSTQTNIALTVPPDIEVEAYVHFSLINGSAMQMNVGYPGDTLQTPGIDSHDLRVDAAYGGSEFSDYILTNTSQEIAFIRAGASASAFSIWTKGWIDKLGDPTIGVATETPGIDIFVNGVNQGTTAGTFVDFAIPPGVKQVKVMFDKMSKATATEFFGIQLGVNGAPEVTGYNSITSLIQNTVSSTLGYTDAFRAASSSTANEYSGCLTFSLKDPATNSWVISGDIGSGVGAPFSEFWSGDKSLAGELDVIRILAGTASATFDNGSINVQYDNQAAIETVQNNLTVNNTFTTPIPAGIVMTWVTETPPTGWLECDGQAISRTTYADLFNEIGVTYGAGDGSTTFNLPDYRGRFLRVWDHGAGVDPDAASRTDRGDGVTGDRVGTKQEDQFESHRHTHDYTTFTESGSTSTQREPANGAGPYTTGFAGGNETRGKNINVMMIIKT